MPPRRCGTVNLAAECDDVALKFFKIVVETGERMGLDLDCGVSKDIELRQPVPHLYSARTGIVVEPAERYLQSRIILCGGCSLEEIVARRFHFGAPIAGASVMPARISAV